MNIQIGDRVRVKQGTDAACKKSSMHHWQGAPNLDGLVFTVTAITNKGRTTPIVTDGIPEGLYELPDKHLELVLTTKQSKGGGSAE